MAATILFWNNSKTTIASAVGPTDTTVTLAPGSGALFSPGPGAGQYGMGTFTDALTGIQTEIVKITGVTGDVLTIVRAQEGTSAQSWSVGDNFQGRVTAGALEAMQGLDVAHADEADKWTTPRNLIIGGDANGSFASVDGTANVTANVVLGTVNANAGSFGDSSHAANITVNAKGLVTAASNVLITPAAIGAPPNNRTITGTSPITGGGDLSANRTLGFDFTADAPFSGNITVPNQAVGNNSAKAANTAFVLANTAFTTLSSLLNQSITVSSAIGPFAHGLFSVKGGSIILRCTSADAGYSLNDRVFVCGVNDDAGGCNLWFNGTNAGVIIGPNIEIVNKTAFTRISIDPTKWTMDILVWS